MNFCSDHSDSHRVIKSHTESLCVIHSHSDSYRNNHYLQSHTESIRVIQSHKKSPKSFRFTQKHKKSHGVIQSHKESVKVKESQTKLSVSCLLICHFVNLFVREKMGLWNANTEKNMIYVDWDQILRQVNLGSHRGLHFEGYNTLINFWTSHGLKPIPFRQIFCYPTKILLLES